MAEAQSSSAAKTTSVSFDSLLAAGYEIKAVTLFSDTAVKEAYSNPNVHSQIIVTLQKGPSLATCGISAANWVNLPDTTMASATLYSRH